MANKNTNQIIESLLTLKELPPEQIMVVAFTATFFLIFSLILLNKHLKRCENFLQFISYPKLKGKEWILFIINLILLALLSLWAFNLMG